MPLSGDHGQAQDSKSAALAKELTALLQERKLDSVAARHPGSADQFVAALYFPGQLIVVLARTTAPAVVNEKLVRREFRDVYIDLNSASIPESRVMITDGGADGLRATREPNQPFDTHDAGGKSVRFDGNWREDRMSEKDYMTVFSQRRRDVHRRADRPGQANSRRQRKAVPAPLISPARSDTEPAHFERLHRLGEIRVEPGREHTIGGLLPAIRGQREDRQRLKPGVGVVPAVVEQPEPVLDRHGQIGDEDVWQPIGERGARFRDRRGRPHRRAVCFRAWSPAPGVSPRCRRRPARGDPSGPTRARS